MKQITRMNMTHDMTIRYYGHKTLFQGRSKGEAREKQGRRKGEGSSKICRFSHRYLRYAVSLLLMMVVGVNTAWGQDGTDYSGTYYIASNSHKVDGNNNQYTYDPTSTANFYLCPTENWYFYKATNSYYDASADESLKTMPFLTTYKCKDDGNYDATKAIWIVEKHQTEANCYYIIQKKTGRYMVSNGSIGSNVNRMRVHLEKVADADALTDLDDLALFEITKEDGYLCIKPHSDDGKGKDGNDVCDYLVVNNGNSNTLQAGGTKPDGPNGTYGKNTGGIISVYKKEVNAYWSFEDVIKSPVITHNSDNTINITYPDAGETNITMYYTTDGSEPDLDNIGGVNPTQQFTTTFALPANSTEVKAISVKDKGTTNEIKSNKTATLTITVRFGRDNLYLLQSVENTNFYMIQGDKDDSNRQRINTSSVARSSMAWYFINAGIGATDGIQYYYLVNNKDGQYACYYKENNSDVVRLKDATDFDSSDQFKFSIHQHANGGYFIKPLNYGANYGLNKGNGNNANNSLWVSGAANATARWNIVPISNNTLPFEDTSFNKSTDTKTYYYKIGNANDTNKFIIPPTGTTGNAACVSTSATEDESMAWYFKDANSSDDWLEYYYIVNAQTGKYIYYEKEVSTATQTLAFTTRSLSESGTEKDRFQFVIAKTTTDGAYYLVPKLLRHLSNNNYCLIWRDGTNPLKTNLQRADNNRKWTFTSTAYHCTKPEVTYNDVTDQIEISSSQGAEVYYTIDGANNEVIPSSSTHYTAPIDDSESTQTIRAVCARSEDGSDNSDVVTIIFNPTITLDGASSITYDGNEHQPGITSVKVDENTIAASEYSYYYLKDGVTVTNCKDAGTYTVVVTDAVGPEGANYFVYGATTFTINKADISPSISIENWSYKDAASTPVVTGNDGEGEVTYEYKPQGAADTEYSTTVPETRGNYTVRATIAASTNYNGSNAATANFAITAKSLGSGITPATGITIDAITKSGNTYSVPGINHNSTPLTVGTEGTAYDYSLTIDDSNSKYHIVTFTGANNYTGSVSAKFVNVDFHANSDNSEWTSSFVIGSSEGAFATPTTGYSAYIVTGANGNAVTTQLLSYIPEDVPVILLSTASSNGFMAQPTSGEAPDVTENKLAVSTGASFTAGQIYILYNGEFVLNAPGTLAAGKVYLPKSAITSGSAPSRLFINWGEPSGIEVPQLSNLKPQTSTGTWYTLDGRRLNSKPARKGLYLMNGQKVIVR